MLLTFFCCEEKYVINFDFYCLVSANLSPKLALDGFWITARNSRWMLLFCCYRSDLPPVSNWVFY
jgi:hypothetical protein